jgi:hypothetical protein
MAATGALLEQDKDAAVKAVLDEMRDNMKSIDAQTTGCESLLEFAKSKNISSKHKGMVIKAVCNLNCKAMKVVPRLELQRTAMILIAGMIDDDQEAADLGGKEGCVGAVLDAMRTHASMQDLQALGCYMLLLFAAGGREKVLQHLWMDRALDVVYDAMSLSILSPSSSTDEDEQHLGDKFKHSAYHFIRIMYERDHALKIRNPLSKKGAEVILGSIRTHLDSPDLLMHSIRQ